MGRVIYSVASAFLLLIEYAAALLPRFVSNQTANSAAFISADFWGGQMTTTFVLLTGTIAFACTAMLGWLGLRRAAVVNAGMMTVSLTVVPWLQLIAIPMLAFAHPSKKVEQPIQSVSLRGALWGLGIALGAEIILTLAFGDFGIALFVGSPFVVGLVTAYFAKCEGDPHPLLAGQQALLLASLVLFGFAYEGLFCLLLAYPLAAVAALIGGGIGIWLAHLRAPRNAALSSIALLPLLFVAETTTPPLLMFHDVRSVEVQAPPAAVWNAIVHMGRIERPPAAPFGWGLAYPVAGRIDGEGVGAVRLGVFSTGTAYERVTRWQPGRELWFDVLTDPPMMRETNPFGPVRSAHLEGYFATRDARFTLTSLAGGKTRLTLATDHALKVGPTFYFGPLARWAVAQNKARVLNHFRLRAEARQTAN